MARKQLYQRMGTRPRLLSGILSRAKSNLRATWETFKSESTPDAVLGGASRNGRNNRALLRDIRGNFRWLIGK